VGDTRHPHRGITRAGEVLATTMTLGGCVGACYGRAQPLHSATRILHWRPPRVSQF